MAEWSKALRSGRSPLLWAWVRIPLLTNIFLFSNPTGSSGRHEMEVSVYCEVIGVFTQLELFLEGGLCTPFIVLKHKMTVQ